ncbi:P-loop containing nucleoside triphosphate hydrolase protein, partial [Mycena pura]
LPSEPKIFHGREAELSQILTLFRKGAPRIAILGAAGMGKTSLARAVIHHTDITSRYGQHRHFVCCDSAANKLGLAALIGSHLGLKPGRDLTLGVVQHLSNGPPSILILDNLETVWEPAESQSEIEEFLSLLTDIDHLGLMITMRGAERPHKVSWSRPFLLPLEPLDKDASLKTFIEIADGGHEPAEIDKVLALSNNMPLAINLLAHLVDVEGCTSVLSRWADQKTSVISDGHDRRSNLDLSISLSLSSPRLKSLPQAYDLLSLLSMLPDGCSDVDLVQSKLPLDNILGAGTRADIRGLGNSCEALLRTALAYNDQHKRLKVLVPIREYLQKNRPPKDQLVRCLLKYFQELLHFEEEYSGTVTASSIGAQIVSNIANAQSIICNGLKPGHSDLKDS